MKLTISAIFLLCLGISCADDFTEKFEALKKAGDNAAIEEFLEKAATAEAENPNFYAVAGNHWWGIAGSVSVTPIPEGQFELDPKDLSIIDPKTGKKVGAVGKAGDVAPEIPRKALKLLSDGAKKFPQRADISLGLAHVQKDLGMNDGYVDTLTALLSTAKKDPKALKWMKDGSLPEPPETFLPETVQTYTAALFNANTPATDALCSKLLSAVTDAFPDHPYAYNLKAALADATGKPKEALSNLGIAHEKAPDDPLILSNLAGAFAKASQNKKAIAAYEKLLKLQLDDGARKKAEAALERLKKAK